MKKLLIVGYFGFENFGDEWLLSNLIKLLKKFSKTGNQIYVLYNIKKCKKINNISYIPRWNFFWIINILFKVDTVIYCGGLFQDYTSVLSGFYYLLIFLFAKILFKKILLLNTEFSFKKIPFFIVKFLCFNSDKVILRNELEVKKILKHNKKYINKILFCPDICYIDFAKIDKSVDSLKKDFRKIALMIKAEKKELQFLVNFCKDLLRKYKLVFIPLHLKEDYKFCLEIAKHIKNCEVRVWSKIEDYKFMLKDIDLVVTSRLHGVVLSDVLNIPFVCFSEQDKIKDLVFSNYKANCAILSELNLERLEKCIIYPQNNKNYFFDRIENIFKNLSKFGYF